MEGSEYARREFELLEKIEYQDDDHKPIVLGYKDEILALVDKFNRSGQSGGSAPFTAGCISQAVRDLCLYRPLGGVTDTHEEWNKLDYGSPISYQHRRLSSVFKDEDGRAYFIEAIVFQGSDEWDTFTGVVDGIGHSHYIKAWPFYPKTFYIDVTRERNETDPNRVSCGDGDYIYHIKNPEQLKKVWEYYDQMPAKR